MLTIERDSGYSNKFANYRVVLDDVVIGQIADGQTQKFDIKKGTHTLYLKLDWARSNKVTFETNGVETMRFKCASSVKGFRIIFAIVYATVLSHRHIKLERLE